MNDLIRYYQDVPPETWIAIFGAGGVSVVTQVIKKLAKLENTRVIQILFAAVAFAASGLQYLASNAHSLPPDVLGIHTAVLIGLGSQWYAHIVKPANNYIKQFKKVEAEGAGAITGAAVISAGSITRNSTTTVTVTPAADPSVTPANF